MKKQILRLLIAMLMPVLVLAQEPQEEPDVAVNSVAALRGIYTTADEVVTFNDDGSVDIYTDKSCDMLLSIIGAGELSLLDSLIYSPDAFITEDGAPPADPAAGVQKNAYAILRQGNTGFMFRAVGSTYCKATLEPATQQPFVMTGARTMDDEALSFAYQCHNMNVMGFGSVLVIQLVYDLPDGSSALLVFGIPMETGTHELENGAQVLISPSRDLLPEILIGMGNMGDLEVYASESGGTIEVTSVEPLTGTVALDNLQGMSGGSLGITTGFQCHVSGMETSATE